MPWNIIADEHLKLVFFAMHGHITPADMIALHGNMLARFEGRGFAVFVHLVAAKFVIDTDALRQLACLKPVFNKIAIYTPSPVSQEVCRAYGETSSLLHGHRSIAAFGTTTEAFAWLTNTTDIDVGSA